MHWLIPAGEGIVIAFVFYALVRVRMWLGPRMRDRFGEHARTATWVLTIGLMVVAANVGLIWLRRILHDEHGVDAPFLHEMLYAFVAFAVGFGLVFWHVIRKRGHAHDPVPGDDGAQGTEQE